MSGQKWTREPLCIIERSDTWNLKTYPAGRGMARVQKKTGAESDARRLKDCWNGCLNAGIANPAALGELLERLKLMRDEDGGVDPGLADPRWEDVLSALEALGVTE